MTVSKRLRFEILRRDDYACRYCGRKAPEWPLTVDHVIPVALGGTDEPSNLITACVDCNSGKTSIGADQANVDQVTADALRWSAAMRLASSISTDGRHSLQQEMDAYADAFDRKWKMWTYKWWTPESEEDDPYIERPPRWRMAVDSYRKAGLEIEFVEYAIETAMNADTRTSHYAVFKYACGVCRRELERRANIARELIDLGQV